MTRPRRGQFYLVLLCCLTLGPTFVGSSQPFEGQRELGQATDKAFDVFDATLFTDRPPSETWGATRLKVLYESSLGLPPDRSAPARENAIRTAVRTKTQPGDLVCLDIERWMGQVQKGELSEQRLLQYHLEVIEAARTVRPDARFGFYAIPPIRNYWDAIRPDDDPRSQKWSERNALLGPLGTSVDVIFPSLYAFYDGIEDWEKYARANLEEARQYGKPVYAFLWFEYHNSNKKLAGQPIPAQFWRRQLNLVYELADGVVIWGGYQQPWNPDADWLRTLEEWQNGKNIK